MKKQTSTLQRLKTAAGAATFAVVGTLVYSTTTFANSAQQILDGVNMSGQSGGTEFDTGVQTVINVLLFIIGLVSVIMIIIGGFRYVTSNGDSAQTKAAKDTILYAVIGLIVAIMAFAIVTWVVNVFLNSQP